GEAGSQARPSRHGIEPGGLDERRHQGPRPFPARLADEEVAGRTDPAPGAGRAPFEPVQEIRDRRVIALRLPQIEAPRGVPRETLEDLERSVEKLLPQRGRLGEP